MPSRIPPTNRLPWPHLLAFMDEALAAPPRSSLVVSAYGGQPITVKDAEIMRQTMSKQRAKIRARSSQFVSPYDALVIRAEHSLSGCELQIHYIDEEETRTADPAALGQLTQYQRGCPCYITLRNTQTGLELGVGNAERPAPSFSEAWRAIRPYLPGRLVLVNAYAIEEGLDYEVVGTGAAPAAGPSPLFGGDDDASFSEE
jgi:hypothetical protein